MFLLLERKLVCLTRPILTNYYSISLYMSENLNNLNPKASFIDSKPSLSISIIIIGVLVCLTTIGVAVFFSQTDFYIKNIGTATTQDGKLTNTINVTGDGLVFAKPDMVTIQTSISQTKSTSREALETVNQKISQIQDILTNSGISKDDIQTTNLSIYTEYDWSGNLRKVLGQTASQSLTFDVKNIDDKATKVSEIIDKIANVDDVTINSVDFGILNKETILSKARELAFDKAKQKAEELAKLGGVRLLKPVSITDSSFDTKQTDLINYKSDSLALGASPISATNISTGQLQISLQVAVVFGIE